MNRNEKILDLVRKIMSSDKEGYEIRLKTVTKNNGVTKTGILFKTECASPIIYLDEYSDLDECDAAVRIVYAFNDALKDISSFEDVTKSILSFEKTKDKLYVTLINKDKNKDILKNCPYKEVMPGIVGIVNVYISEDAHAKVTYKLLQNWDIDVFKLFEIAMENTERLFPVKVGDFYGMTFISNKNMNRGAVAVFYENKKYLYQFAKEWNCDLILIPSSIHEFLIFKAEMLDFMNPDEIKTLINNVNKDVVNADEILSDVPFIYHKNTNTIELLCL